MMLLIINDSLCKDGLTLLSRDVQKCDLLSICKKKEKITVDTLQPKCCLLSYLILF